MHAQGDENLSALREILALESSRVWRLVNAWFTELG